MHQTSLGILEICGLAAPYRVALEPEAPVAGVTVPVQRPTNRRKVSFETVSLTGKLTLGPKITHGDLEKAYQSRTANDMDDLQGYLTTGVGQLIDIIRKMRTVLETHCRTTYSGFFCLPTDWSGDIVRKIREGGETHPEHALHDELDQINGYTSQYHHGEDLGDATPDNIDPSELTGSARRTLRTVNALQA